MYSKRITFAVLLATIFSCVSTTRADFWSDLRDKALGKKELTKSAARDNVTFRNLTNREVNFVTASSQGIITGWYRVLGGQQIELAFSPGTFFLHAVDHQSQQLLRFGAPTAYIPVNNAHPFQLQYQKDGSFKVEVNGKSKGTFGKEFLGQLGFAEKEFFQLQTSRRVEFNAPPPVKDQQNPMELRPPSLGQPEFEIRLMPTDKTWIIRQPNGSWIIYEGSNQALMQQSYSSGNAIRLTSPNNGSQVEIRGNQLYTSTGNGNWKLVGNGTWRNK